MKIALLFAMCFAIAGCSPMFQKRGVEAPIPWRSAPSLEELAGGIDISRARIELPGQPADAPNDRMLKALNLRLDTEARSVERYSGQGYRFALNFVEISDDGEINPAQHAQAMRSIDCEVALGLRDRKREELWTKNRCGEFGLDWSEQTNGTILVTFVHGWHHGCSTCDRDVTCFRSLLQRLSIAEQATGRRVVGVYVGWRGRQIRARVMGLDGDYLTLWGRKLVAERLGRTAGKELLNTIGERWETDLNLKMVTVGHSLGAAFLLSAARGRLTGHAGDVTLGRDSTTRSVRAQGLRSDSINDGQKAVRARFGDLTILLNPAVEADEWDVFDEDLYDREFEAKWEATGTRNPTWFAEQTRPVDAFESYSPVQRPVMIAIGSKADGAVSNLFPVSRVIRGLFTFRLGTIFKSDERKAVGHYWPHVTHELRSTTPANPAATALVGERLEESSTRTCTCQDTYLKSGDSGELDAYRLQSGIEMKGGDPTLFSTMFGSDVFKNGRWELSLAEDRGCAIRGAIGQAGQSSAHRRCARGWDMNSPYIAIQTDGSMVAGHSDIFNDRLFGFVRDILKAVPPRPRSGADLELK